MYRLDSQQDFWDLGESSKKPLKTNGHNSSMAQT